MTRPTLSLCLVALLAASAAAQDVPAVVIRVKPAALTLALGETARLEAEVVDALGLPVTADVFFFSRDRRSLRVEGDGAVTARKAGQFEVVARAMVGGQRGPSAIVPVTVPYPKPVGIEIRDVPATIYVGTTIRIEAVVVDAAGLARDDLEVSIATTDTDVATVDAFGFVTGLTPGRCAIRGRAEDLEAIREIQVVANPVASITLAAGATARCGEVVHFVATTRGRDGAEVRDVPVHFSFDAAPDDHRGPGATGQMAQDGRFVAAAPGLYTVVATSGAAFARKTIRVEPRFKEERKLVQVGHGEVLDTHTSDLWVWEGVDGRDYAVTGTWGAKGEAHFWDVTNPAEMKRIATVKVDARTVNDVKVSKDGRICVISREGASNRKNGIVIYDVSDPRDPKELSTFDDELTGGVHNVFIDGHHVYALSAGRRYDVIDIADPRAPRRVGTYQVFEPGAAIHDVWVDDGIAYSSNWSHGVHLVDVGNGIAGGSPESPVKISSYAYPSGWNHAAFPYRSETTGKFYVVAGDEAFPYGLNVEGKPTYARGWMHFIDFTDLKNPQEVARYEVPEAGTHNLWIEDDLLYAAYYNGGLRVVDISGELMGNLYEQGREIAWFLPTHKDGFIPNAPMVWGPQPHKGHIFFSDWNTGLWSAKLVTETVRP